MSIGIGDALREAREQQGRSLEDAAQAVRARTEQLRALEDERFDSFPGQVYAKGFLRSYATWLGLDPKPLLEAYAAESGEEELRAAPLVTGVPSGGPRRSTPPPWLAWLLVAIVVVAGLGFLGIITGGLTPETAGSEDPVATPPPPTAQPEAPAPDPGPADPQPPPEPEPEPAFEGVEVLVALEEASWLRVMVDGALVLEETLQAGETRQYQGEDEVLVRFGNAGGVRVQHNGEDLGPAGSRGQVTEIRFTADDVDRG